MASPLVQKARQRKMIYFGLIVALFTISLIYREFVIKPQATRLQLRETARGEVELTSSAVRLMLTGSRGLAVTILWYNAMEMQKRNEWNELELLVKSITKLQPYFITPWLYQSWNISFNVAVECDRPRDKYYYISRGLELLAEGERRNSGTVEKASNVVIPGNPELRWFMGFIYQLKIGNSDEHKTMRCLFEMSCIDPIERDPDRFLGSGDTVNTAEFAKFAIKHPRLVRRLNEQLGYVTPKRVVDFLRENQDIPGRFKPIDRAQAAMIKESDLKDPLSQFPILPPYESRTPEPPDPKIRELSNEAIDVFLICRAWYEYAQEPLPPPEENPVAMPREYDKLRYRAPKGMMIQIFRQYPARAQVYIAETLDSEGFFDDEGWSLTDGFKTWYPNRANYICGTEGKYQSRNAWKAGYQYYKKFGQENGIYLSPGNRRHLEKLAADFEKKTGVKPGEEPQPKSEWLKDEDLRKGLEARAKLKWNQFYKGLVNFDAFLYQAEGEFDPVTVAMRKRLFQAEREYRHREDAVTLAKFQPVWQLYLQACVKNPRFAGVSSVQEDICEAYQKYLRRVQKAHRQKFTGPPLLAAIAFWPVPNWQEALVQSAIVSDRAADELFMLNTYNSRIVYGPLDTFQYFEAPDGKELQEWMSAWIQGANASNGQPLTGMFAFPGQENFLLTRATPFVDERPLPTDQPWRALIPATVRELVRQRLGLLR
jgi:hypothetical protein